jgi:hypothetical protein
MYETLHTGTVFDSNATSSCEFQTNELDAVLGGGGNGGRFNASYPSTSPTGDTGD